MFRNWIVFRDSWARQIALREPAPFTDDSHSPGHLQAGFHCLGSGGGGQHHRVAIAGQRAERGAEPVAGQRAKLATGVWQSVNLLDHRRGDDRVLVAKPNRAATGGAVEEPAAVDGAQPGPGTADEDRAERASRGGASDRALTRGVSRGETAPGAGLGRPSPATPGRRPERAVR